MYHYKTIKIEINNRVGVIEFNRPEVMNAFNEEMVGEVTSAMKELNNDKSVACIIIKGNGRCFSAGFDLKEASQTSLKGNTQKNLHKILISRGSSGIQRNQLSQLSMATV